MKKEQQVAMGGGGGGAQRPALVYKGVLKNEFAQRTRA
jgi:hypothetical protein